MKLRHGSVSRGLDAGARTAGFVATAVMCAGLMLSGCGEKRGGIEPRPNRSPSGDVVPCSKRVTESREAREVVAGVHVQIVEKQDAVLRMLGAKPDERVNITWHLKVDGDGKVDTLNVDASCGKGACSKDPKGVLSEMPQGNVAPTEECSWDISTVIES
jgi:hypothetical protein